MTTPSFVTVHDAARKAVADSPCASYWLKDALESAWRRDPVDALRDAETLAAILTLRVENER